MTKLPAPPMLPVNCVPPPPPVVSVLTASVTVPEPSNDPMVSESVTRSMPSSLTKTALASFIANAPGNAFAPFDRPFHLLLNVAVGGNFPGPPNGAAGFPAEMVVSGYVYDVDSYLYHDIVVDYEFSRWGNTRLTLGVTNISDEEPPFIDNAFNAKTDPNTYRMFGTGWFARISQTF